MAKFEVMKVGIFKGASYVITHTDDGLYNWYCGYVEIPKKSYLLRATL